MIQYIQILVFTLAFYNIGLTQNHPPQPITRDLISAFPYETDSLKIPARYFDNGSYDLETPQELLRFSYSANPDDSIRILTCADAEFFIIFSVYVFDEEDAYEYNQNGIYLIDQFCGIQSQSITDTQSPVMFITEKILPTHPDPNISFCLSAEDFVLYGYDNSDPNNTMVNYSFSSNPNDTVRCYSCMDAGYYLLDIYAIDTAGNQIHIPTSIDVRANGGCLIDLLDTMPPIALCTNDTIFSIDSTLLFTIFPEMFNDGSYDDKTEAENLVFHFSGTETDSLIFTCDDLGDQMVSLIVTDEVGNSSECTSIIVIADSEKYCNPSSSKNVSSTLLYKLFPNPSDGFYIQRNSGISSELYSIKVIDASGRIAYESAVSHTGDYILPNVTTGMYMVLIVSVGGSPSRFIWMRVDR